MRLPVSVACGRSMVARAASKPCKPSLSTHHQDEGQEGEEEGAPQLQQLRGARDEALHAPRVEAMVQASRKGADSCLAEGRAYCECALGRIHELPLVCSVHPPCPSIRPLGLPHLQALRVECPRVLQLRRHVVILLPPERGWRPRRCTLLLLKRRAWRCAVAVPSAARWCIGVHAAPAQLPLELGFHCKGMPAGHGSKQPSESRRGA